MTIKALHPFALFASATLLAACASQPPADAPSQTLAAQPVNDFPTQARVEFVLQCMDRKGGQNYDNLYACVCNADKVAEKIRYNDFAEAQTFTYLSSLAGDAGSAMRDAPQSRPLKKQLQEAMAYAKESCPPGLPVAGAKSSGK